MTFLSFLYLCLKDVIRILGIGDGELAAVFYDFRVLHHAALEGHLEVFKYLVEEHGADVDMAGPDEGSCKVTEFLLSKGVPVDIDFNGRGTPLYSATSCDKDNTLKILLDHHANPNTVFIDIAIPLTIALVHRSSKCMKLLIEAGADVNGKGSFTSPLITAIEQGGFTNFVRLLLKAGADPNIRDNLEEKKSMVKSVADKSFRKKDYKFASAMYGTALNCGEDATLYSNRSLCKLKMGDGAGALLDANRCRMMRPNWAKACYRQGAAHMLLKQACDALQDAKKLDPQSEEIEMQLR
ncbi:hypothetical protein HU200_040414 [Digitaria exilis]|uniref:Uncharacterized protein n=1 Tax=Digitaria exilis TaxID=1010633 RepID=A0A835BK53_9POAL|nr:hypothetical protein HU200_040414 [Digitaria exilis]